MNNIYAALEVGTTRTVMAIGESENGGRLKVTCHAEIPSTRVRKSQILDINEATKSIRSVLHEIEKKQDEAGLKVTIGNAFLVVNGQHVKANPVQGMAQLNGKVSSEDINEALRSSQAIPTPKDCELLDIFDQDYIVDDRKSTLTPKGLAGHTLKLNTLQIIADKSCIQDARTAAEAAHLEIRDPLFAVTCAADAVLEDQERRNGVLVLDIGGGSTGYAVYSDGFLVSAGALGVGGDHINNDIAHAFQTTIAQATEIKHREANALLGADGAASARVKVPGSNPLMESRTLSRRSLNTVVNARLRELFSILREILETHDLFNRVHAGVVLTGGGARMNGIETLAEQTLGMSVRLGRPINVDGLDDVDFPPAFAAIAGALLYAHRNYKEKSIFDGFRRLFK